MTPNAESRDLEIDRFRGALVILMVVGNYLSGVQFVPAFLKHAPDIGFTIADTVAPAFVFVMGLNFGPSFARRAKNSRTNSYRQIGMRYLSLLGIGAVISAGSNLVGTPEDWGVLQAIGIAGLIGMLFIELPTWARFASGVLILTCYQYLLDEFMLESVLGSAHGGLFGAIAWAALLIISTALADLWRRSIVIYSFGTGLLAAAAIVSIFVVPVSKNRVSLSYILLTAAISALVFLLMKLGSAYARSRRGLLCWWGENALALYLAHLLVLAIFVTPEIDWWYAKAKVWLAAVQLAAALGVLTVVARAVTNRNHVNKLSMS